MGRDPSMEEIKARLEEELNRVDGRGSKSSGPEGNAGTRAMNRSGAAVLAETTRHSVARGTVPLLVGERNKHESKNAILACNDFMRMGPGRRQRLLLQQYLQEAADNPGYRPPTLSKGTLNRWSCVNGWPERASKYDEQADAEKTARRDRILSTGLALIEERITKLVRLTDLLEEELYARSANGSLPNLWVQDVKQIGSGKNIQRVDVVRFNSSIVDQYRHSLGDIASEMGHRVRGVDVTTKGERLGGGRLTDDERASEIAQLLESTRNS